MSEETTSVHYINYLALDKVLDAQNPLSGKGKEAAHGAGISAAAQVADKGVEALLTGRVGPKALPVLEKAGVKAVNDVSGSILDAIDKYTGLGRAPQQETNQKAAQVSSPNAGQGQGRGRGKGQRQGKGEGRGQCRR
jgi:predicted Fe-Mo cluster-binding NifX family protein